MSAAALATLVAAGGALAPLSSPPVVSAAEVPPPQLPPLVSLDLPYVSDGDPAHRLDVFVPAGTSSRPLVVFVHGGSWTHGSKAEIRGGAGQRAQAFRDVLLGHGYAVASVEYRFSHVARFPAQLHDVKAAVRYLRARSADLQLDPTRFAVAGESAGGHLADLVGYTGLTADRTLEGDLGVTGESSAVSAVVSYYGVADLSRVVPDRVEKGCARGQTGATSPEGRLVGVDPQTARRADVVRRANPVTYVGVTSPPTMLLHGTRDCLVPAAQSTRLYRLLCSFGVPAEYITLDAPHGGPSFHTTPRVTARVLAFLDRHLRVER
ncbi:alpha/beta hydrolase [Mobilicoccus pelagius]|uniref:BD-FAE-like domain-containing protein n=1 Tax=Mobilicoccus pelagius NBRC 104925 TaxID=1089455 RepID=H5UR82_9MICO|nr:alpha/beta hydrolase [Mobilicoccus pelagius]GAB48240.1 hypothetical protein MOPEL_067_00900 [Mobilicoccus pelagius NBRC 104925]